MAAGRGGRTAGRLLGALLACLLLLLPAGAASFASETGRDSAPAATAAVEAVELRVFVREGCPHCAAAEDFLRQLQRQRPGLRVQFLAVDEDPEALEELLRISREAGISAPGVPSFVLDGTVLVGFDDAAGRGRDLLALIDQRRTDEGIRLGPFGTLRAGSLGLPLFTLVLGLLDGFNPCAMWVLLFLLSLLVHWHDRRRLALVAGTFVLVSALVYYAFLAAWLNVFLLLGFSDGLRILLGVLALAVGVINVREFRRAGPDFVLSIPNEAKPGIFARMRQVTQSRSLPAALIGVAVLAVVVNAVELLCTAGIPAVYTAVLSQQNLPPAAHYGYLGLYILGYIADDSLMVGAAVFALGSHRLTEEGGRWLKLISGAVMLVLGLLLLRPGWLL